MGSKSHIYTAPDTPENRAIVERAGGSVRSNPLTGSPSHDIPLELYHGRSLKQAQAIAMSEQRRRNNPGQVRLNRSRIINRVHLHF